MKKQRIVIASVLKPVDDTRMLEKIAASLNDSGEFQCFIIGYPSKADSEPNGITLLPLKPFARLSFARWLAPLKVLLSIIKVKPEILIVNTHELLFVAVLNRIFFGARIFYDIRENYYRNLRHTDAYPAFFRTLLALLVRLREKLWAPFLEAFFLAEKGYQHEMNFFGRRSIVLENKASARCIRPRRTDPDFITLLFSGTLASATGVFSAIRLAKALHAAEPRIRLHIAGYTPIPETLKRLAAETDGHPYIQITGGGQLVPHTEIEAAIASADFGIVCYPSSPHTENAVPTKLYEYLSWRLPILLQPNPSWTAMCDPCGAAVHVDFDNPDIPVLLRALQTGGHYRTEPLNTTWDSEAPKLLGALRPR